MGKDLCFTAVFMIYTFELLLFLLHFLVYKLTDLLTYLLFSSQLLNVIVVILRV